MNFPRNRVGRVSVPVPVDKKNKNLYQLPSPTESTVVDPEMATPVVCSVFQSPLTVRDAMAQGFFLLFL